MYTPDTIVSNIAGFVGHVTIFWFCYGIRHQWHPIRSRFHLLTLHITYLWLIYTVLHKSPYHSLRIFHFWSVVLMWYLYETLFLLIRRRHHRTILVIVIWCSFFFPDNPGLFFLVESYGKISNRKQHIHLIEQINSSYQFCHHFLKPNLCSKIINVGSRYIKIIKTSSKLVLNLGNHQS